MTLVKKIKLTFSLAMVVIEFLKMLGHEDALNLYLLIFSMAPL